MSKKKNEFFTEEMGRNIFVFDSKPHEPYRRKGSKKLIDVGRIYHPHRKKPYRTSLYGRLRFG